MPHKWLRRRRGWRKQKQCSRKLCICYSPRQNTAGKSRKKTQTRNLQIEWSNVSFVKHNLFSILFSYYTLPLFWNLWKLNITRQWKYWHQNINKMILKTYSNILIIISNGWWLIFLLKITYSLFIISYFLLVICHLPLCYFLFIICYSNLSFVMCLPKNILQAIRTVRSYLLSLSLTTSFF